MRASTKRLIFRLFKVLMTIVVVVPIISIIVVSFLFSYGCGYKSELKKIQNLSDERFAKLYQDMKSYYFASDDMSRISQDFSASSDKGLPEEFSDLDITYVAPRAALIMVGGCYDNKAFLNFRGYERDPSSKLNQDPEIILCWGNRYSGGSEVLWTNSQKDLSE